MRDGEAGGLGGIKAQEEKREREIVRRLMRECKTESVRQRLRERLLGLGGLT